MFSSSAGPAVHHQATLVSGSSCSFHSRKNRQPLQAAGARPQVAGARPRAVGVPLLPLAVGAPLPLAAGAPLPQAAGALLPLAAGVSHHLLPHPCTQEVFDSTLILNGQFLDSPELLRQQKEGVN